MPGYIPRQLLDQVRTDNSDPNWELTTRPAMFPFLADYTNSQTGEHAGGLAMPSMVTEPANALMRLLQNFGQGPDYGVEWDNPDRSEHPNKQDMGTLGETFFGGNALSGARLLESAATRGVGAGEALAARALSDTGKPSPIGAAVAGAEGNVPLRGFRGKRTPEELFPDDQQMVWASSRPDVADSYALPGEAPALAPADFRFSNPREIDAAGQSWHSIPGDAAPDLAAHLYPDESRLPGLTLTTDALAEAARAKGHDGLIIRNLLDRVNSHYDGTADALGDTYAALTRGTVKSPLTGETLFSDTGKPSLFGAAVADPYQDQDPRWNSLFNY